MVAGRKVAILCFIVLIFSTIITVIRQLSLKGEEKHFAAAEDLQISNPDDRSNHLSIVELSREETTIDA